MSAKERFFDSSWITDIWDWIQQLLARLVPSVLFVTMVCACYGLIPGAPPIPDNISVIVFVCQFIALDVGGITLDLTAKRRGLPVKSFTRVTARALICITLATITYAGIEHAAPNINSQVTTWVEVVLVVCRSFMTVLYGYAIHTLKSDQEEEQNRVAELEQALSVKEEEVNALTLNLNGQLKALRQDLNGRANEVNALRVKVNGQAEEIRTLGLKLDHKEAQLNTIKDAHEGSLEAVQEASLTLKGQLTEAYTEVESLRGLLLKAQGSLQIEKQKALTLMAENESLNGQLNESLKATTINLKVNTDELNDAKIVQLDESKNYEARIRALLAEEPGLSGGEISRRLGCSNVTACNWKKRIEKEAV